MGLLRGYEIESKLGFFQEEFSKAAFSSFQNQIFSLILNAYDAIKTDEPLTENIAETDISAQLFHAMKLLALKSELPLTIIPEYHEYTSDILTGKKSSITAKRYDILFSNWSSKQPFMFGIEAKLLIEKNFNNKNASTLIHEYVSDAGMGKFINRIYKSKGCMFGYVLQGDISVIITKINESVENLYGKSDRLTIDEDYEHHQVKLYKSHHAKKWNDVLYHFMLHFN